MNENRYFKSIPDDFHALIKSAVKEARAKEAPRLPAVQYRPYKRLAVALAALVVLIPTTVFGYGVAREHSLSLKQEANHSFRPVVNQTAEKESETILNSPAFVKLTFTVPEGFVESAYGEGAKFHHETNEEKRISLGLTRPDDGKLGAIDNVTSTKEITVNGIDGYLLEYGSGKGFNRQAHLYFKEVNMAFVGYFTDSFSEEEILNFLFTVDVVESTADNCTPYGIYNADVPESYSDGSSYNGDLRLCESLLTPLGEEMHIREEITAKLESISTEKNLSELAPDDFYFGHKIEYTDCVGADGTLLPRISDEWTWQGEGVMGKDYMPEYIGSKTYDQTFVMAKVTYTNTSDTPKRFGVDPKLRILVEEDGKFYYSNARRGDKNFDYFGLLPVYLEGAEEWNPAWGDYNDYLEGKIEDPRTLQFFTCTLAPGESRTITFGWRCDTELMENAYITFYNTYTTEPNWLYPHYTTKVTK